jgi:alpha-glucosidase (family GH31 glycosyl hydrolase)
MRKNRIPCDVIHLDTHWFEKDWYCDLTFSKTRFPDPAGFIRQLADMGFKLSLWQLPYLPEGSELFEELRAVDGFIKNEAGSIYDVGICFVQGFSGIVGVIDFTNPRAVDVYIRWLRRLFDLGARVIKTDFGEAIPLEDPRLILTSRLKLQGFIVSEHMQHWPAALRELGDGVASGRLKYRETVADSLGAAPEAFLGLLKGRNFGKQLVKLV